VSYNDGGFGEVQAENLVEIEAMEIEVIEAVEDLRIIDQNQ
jgi:hypothetical protein